MQTSDRFIVYTLYSILYDDYILYWADHECCGEISTVKNTIFGGIFVVSSFQHLTIIFFIDAIVRLLSTYNDYFFLPFPGLCVTLLGECVRDIIIITITIITITIIWSIVAESGCGGGRH